MNNNAPRLMIMAGGTGGHVFPGLAVAKCLLEQGWQIEWFGTAAGVESRLVPDAGYPLHLLGVNGIRGKGGMTLLKAPFMLLRSIWQSITLLRARAPDCVLGMGGFASGPGAVAAKLLGMPLVIHEQNAIMGSTNKILQYLADRRLEAFPGAFQRRKATYFTGNPVRFDVQQKGNGASDEHKRKILVVGGSRGATALNNALPKLLANAASNTGLLVEVTHQTGQADLELVRDAYRQLGVTAKVEAFISDMADQYRQADLVICRAGAMTVAELAVAGRPSLLVPYPHAIDDHQTANALWLVDLGAAKLVAQDSLGQESTQELLDTLLQDVAGLESMASAALAAAVVDADVHVAQHCMEVCA